MKEEQGDESVRVDDGGKITKGYNIVTGNISTSFLETSSWIIVQDITLEEKRVIILLPKKNGGSMEVVRHRTIHGTMAGFNLLHRWTEWGCTVRL
ncbi:hypothetical protein ACJX0J_005735, partial [Zea mays]